MSNNLVSATVAIYSKVGDPIEFSKSLAEPLASMLGCTVPQGQAAALTCLCEGLTPIDFVRRYHLIQGRPTMRADAMLAEFELNHGGSYRMLKRTPDNAKAEFTTAKGEVYTEEFTWQEALQEDFVWVKGKKPGDPAVYENLKDNYRTPRSRKQMIWARMVSDALRYVCPMLVAGVYTPEEMGDVVEGKLASVQTVPMTASEFMGKEVDQNAKPEQPELVAEPAAEESVEENRLVQIVRDLFSQAFGDEAAKAMDDVLKRRRANSLYNLNDSALRELRDKLTAKLKDLSGN